MNSRRLIELFVICSPTGSDDVSRNVSTLAQLDPTVCEQK